MTRQCDSCRDVKGSVRKMTSHDGEDSWYVCTDCKPLPAELIESTQDITPNECPACQGKFVTGTLYGWICADCGATDESPTRR